MKISGFTLIDLMITIFIVAVLSVIAYPSYRQCVLVSHRVEAKTMLMNVANQEEQLFLQAGHYASLNKLGFVLSGDDLFTEHGFYSVSVGLIKNGYVLTATVSGVQKTDTDCQVLTLTHDNTKTSSPSMDCWK
jgi:type IV pilus assembly protein PilE